MSNLSFRQKYIPGDPGPHHNPYIIPISDKPVSWMGNIVFFIMIGVGVLCTHLLLKNDPDFKNECGLTLSAKK